MEPGSPEYEVLLGEFIAEAREILARVDGTLVALERDPADADGLAAVFRDVHTIKGNCGWLGFGRLEALAHACESLLDCVRNGELELTTEIVTSVFATLDALGRSVDGLERTRVEGDEDFSGLIATLDALREGEVPAGAADDDGVVDELPAREGAIRVGVDLLDRLVNQVGELVLVRNQLLQAVAAGDAVTVGISSQRLDVVTGQLQEGIMRTRMQPVGRVWSRFPRLVRDLALECGKQVRLSVEGGDTELDRTLIEAIRGPLTHIVRNAVDHGIEEPEARTAAGKPAEGFVALRAFHEAGQVVLEATDDGKGIDVERVRRRALDRGLIGSEEAAKLADNEVIERVFEPGFSTAEDVSSISGRGVGLDAVRTSIEAIGGSIAVDSRRGRGTRFRIKIPLTLAIIQALIVRSVGLRYAIPQANLVELLRIEAADVERLIEHVHGARVYRLRGRLLPLVYLDELLVPELARTERPARDVNIAVLEAEDRQFGLVVESVHDTQEIVVKPLGRELRGLSCYAGACIMGDGKVALILDVVGVARMARMAPAGAERHAAESPLATPAPADSAAALLVGVGGGRFAMPLESVDRLEELPRASVERAGNRSLIQYRGAILPLLRVDELVRERRKTPREPAYDEPPADEDTIQVVVHRSGERRIGLVVDRIVDIVEGLPEVTHPSTRDGVLGSTVIRGRITELLDLRAAMSSIGAVPSAAEEAEP